jgi:hypothetical protein
MKTSCPWTKKFIARQPPDDRVVRQRRAQALGHGLQCRVAGEVPERIVDFFECVDIDIEKAQGFGASARPGDATLQKVLELHAIRDLGQRIDACKVTNALFRTSPLGNVLRRVDTIAGFSLLAAEKRAGVGNRDRFAELAFEKRFARQTGRFLIDQRAALAHIYNMVDGHTEEFSFLVAEHVRGRFVDALDSAIAGGNDKCVIHTRQDAVDIVTRNRRGFQLVSHIVEYRGEFAEFSRLDAQRLAIIGVAKLLRCTFELPDSSCLVARDDPERDPGEQQDQSGDNLDPDEAHCQPVCRDLRLRGGSNRHG